MPFLILFAILSGALVAIQGGLNSNLGNYLAHPLQAALVSFSVGTAGLCLTILTLNIGLPSLNSLISAPKYLLLGGLLGAIFITTSVIVIPKIGIASFVLAALTGQILTSLLIDHFGLLNVPVQTIDGYRLAGVLAVFTGVILINKQHLF